MYLNSRILIFGGSGLVGSAIAKNLTDKGYTNVFTPSSKHCDCGNLIEVDRAFRFYTPDYVILAAAKVGGIKANSEQPADFIAQNLLIQNNVLMTAAGCRDKGLKRLIFLGSSCIYPKACPQPIKEEYLLTGPLEPTNQAYAIAKIAGIEMCRSFNKQYGTDFVAVMPCNLYGDNDNYHPDNSHVIPGIIHKMHLKKVKGYHTYTYWGSGNPLREFLHASDLADAAVRLMFYPDKIPHLINVGSGTEISIKNLAVKIAVNIGYKGYLKSNHENDMNGTPRKILDCTLLKSILPGWMPKVELSKGIQLAYMDYLGSVADRSI